MRACKTRARNIDIAPYCIYYVARPPARIIVSGFCTRNRARKKMSHDPHKQDWAKSMISVNVVFQCRGRSKTEECTIVVNRNATVKGFKEHLRASRSITGTISLSDRALNDATATLKDSGVTNDAQISVVSYKPRKTLTHSISVKVADKGLITIKVAPHTKFSEFTHMVQDECWMPVEEQVWYMYKKGKAQKISHQRDPSVVEYYKSMNKEPLVVKWTHKGQVQTGNSL